jgi:hypothetical protein
MDTRSDEEIRADLSYLFDKASQALAARMGSVLGELGMSVRDYCVLAKADAQDHPAPRQPIEGDGLAGDLLRLMTGQRRDRRTEPDPFRPHRQRTEQDPRVGHRHGEVRGPVT